MRKIVLISILFLSLLACEKDAAQFDNLESNGLYNSWILTTFIHKEDLEELDIPDDLEVIVTFLQNDSIFVRSNCNMYQYRLNSDNDELKVYNYANTNNQCAVESDWLILFSGNFNNANKFEITEEGLLVRTTSAYDLFFRRFILKN